MNWGGKKGEKIGEISGKFFAVKKLEINTFHGKKKKHVISNLRYASKIIIFLLIYLFRSESRVYLFTSLI